MLWLTISLAFLLSLAALFYVVSPLLRAQGERWIDEENDHLVELLGRKDDILVAIKELEFDHHMGKISAEDYQRFDQRLRRQAIGYMQQIEKLAPHTASVDDALEAEIARYRRMIPSKPNDNLAVPAMPVADGVASSQHFCTQCGRPLIPGNKFCGHCGAPVALPETSAG